MLKKNIIAALMILTAGVLITSCGDETSPGWEYMPDMYRSPSVKAYESDPAFPDSLTALQPVEGTIPRGWMSYKKLPNTNEGYEASKTELKVPEGLVLDSSAMSDAKILYGMYCAVCHGEKGDGQGILVERKKFLGVPSYADREINIGSVFYVVTNGRNMMGSHASQLKPEERWKVSKYVMQLKSELAGNNAEVDDKVETVISSEPEALEAEESGVTKINDN